MKTTDEIQQELIDDFSEFEDWMDKYTFIIELGKTLPPMDDTLKTEENLVSGCQSKVWIYPQFSNGKISFFVDSDAFITKGMVAMLLKIFNNRTPQEIIDTKLYFIDKIGLSEHLSMNRANGLKGMLDKFYQYAGKHLKK
ncbi:MAG TPA: SufE family protein [Bacteroidales bacterium]|nr:SufE family protein [Bacteroidales bacterium]